MSAGANDGRASGHSTTESVIPTDAETVKGSAVVAGAAAVKGSATLKGAAAVVGTVVSVNTSEKTGVQKTPRESIELVVEHGVEGDAHAGPWHRQVSLLAMESVEKMRAAGAEVDPGAFGENITTRGLVLYELPVGTRMQLGESLAQVTQIGKECHDHCAIFKQVGDCVMPREGIFVRVLNGGTLRPGDEIGLLDDVGGRAAIGVSAGAAGGAEAAGGPAAAVDAPGPGAGVGERP